MLIQGLGEHFSNWPFPINLNGRGVGEEQDEEEGVEEDQEEEERGRKGTVDSNLIFWESSK